MQSNKERVDIIAERAWGKNDAHMGFDSLWGNYFQLCSRVQFEFRVRVPGSKTPAGTPFSILSYRSSLFRLQSLRLDNTQRRWHCHNCLRSCCMLFRTICLAVEFEISKSESELAVDKRPYKNFSISFCN